MKVLNNVMIFENSRNFLSLNKINSIKIKIMNYILNKINLCIELNLDHIILFNISNNNIIIKKEDLINPLLKCKEFYNSIEYYESCIICDTLINSLKV